jgi:hypothetical protein
MRTNGNEGNHYFFKSGNAMFEKYFKAIQDSQRVRVIQLTIYRAVLCEKLTYEQLEQLKNLAIECEEKIKGCH